MNVTNISGDSGAVGESSLIHSSPLRIVERRGSTVVSVNTQHSVEMLRWCNRFMLQVPTIPDERDAFYRAFFDWMSNRFNDTANVDRNIDNISRLIHILLENGNVSRKGRILDFGCGTGLALRVAEKWELSVAGFDYSAAMRAQARSVGMAVVNERCFGTLDACYDGVIASYVLHLQTGEEYVRRIPQMLKPGGGMAVNFHKGRGRAWVEDIILRCGMSCIGAAESPSGHGQIVLYSKEVSPDSADEWVTRAGKVGHSAKCS